MTLEYDTVLIVVLNLVQHQVVKWLDLGAVTSKSPLKWLDAGTATNESPLGWLNLNTVIHQAPIEATHAQITILDIDFDLESIWVRNPEKGFQ